METNKLAATLKAMLPAEIRYVRPLRKVDFPTWDPEWELGETSLHQFLCEVLRAILRVAATPDTSTVGSDQFVFFDASDPKRKCAPDAFLKLGVPFRHFDSWKTWQSGVPELCVEILSSSDHEKLTMDEKLARFHSMGVAEVIAFDPAEPEGSRLRAWDLIDGDLLERIVEGERTPCATLNKWFVIAAAPDRGLREALRLAHDPEGNALILTELERELIEKDARIAELESQLAAIK